MQKQKGCYGDLHAVLWRLPWHQELECFAGAAVALPPPAAQINKAVLLVPAERSAGCLLTPETDHTD